MINITPLIIVETLSDIGRKLDTKASEVERLDKEHVSAKAAYRKAYAKAFLTADGSMDIRRYIAEEKTAAEFQNVELAEQVLRAGKESLRVLRDRLEICRSLGAVMRLEWSGQS